MNLLKKWQNLALPYDLYERHAVVSRLLEKRLPAHDHHLVLDVGGRIGLLARFLPFPTIALNPDGTGHLVGDGNRLPFATDTFTAVVNIDTLEHLPEPNRLPFIQECLRVSQKHVIVAAPYGSQEHIQLEKDLHDLHEQIAGRPHPYLSEHVAYGLPAPDQLERLAKAFQPSTTKFYYAGDYTWQGRSFARAVQAHQQPRLLARLINLYNQISELALLHPVAIRESPAPTSNRFYLVITKSKRSLGVNE